MEQVLLSRLEKVRVAGPARWMACCPAHPDGRPWLSIRTLPDSRMLVHCFGGCSVEEICKAVGLDLNALYPPKALGHAVKPSPATLITPLQALEIIEHDVLLVVIFASDLGQDKTLSDSDRARLMLAARRIHAAYVGALP